MQYVLETFYIFLYFQDIAQQQQKYLRHCLASEDVSNRRIAGKLVRQEGGLECVHTPHLLLPPAFYCFQLNTWEHLKKKIGLEKI